MKNLVLAAFTLSLLACTPAPEEKRSDVEVLDKGIVISDARIRYPLPGRAISAGYFDIENHGATADRLVSASSPIAGRVEIHTVEETNGVMKMRKVSGVELSPNEMVSFKPGGKHLMMFDVALEDGQTDAAITLDFETAPSVTIIAELTDDPIRMKEDHSHH